MADNTKAGESASKQQQMEEEKEELRFVNQGELSAKWTL